ncbi:MAG: large conductance mechanosensitive channel protein MscL [Acidimicrobiales bacterium]
MIGPLDQVDERDGRHRMWKDFKQFVLRGNVMELAIAVIIGAAFTAVVSALVQDLLTPLIAAIVGKPNFSGLYFTVNHSTFLYGAFVNALLTFVIVALVVFFFVMKPLTALMHRMGVLPPAEPPRKPCPECTTEIPEAARRCPQCTAVLVAP